MNEFIFLKEIQKKEKNELKIDYDNLKNEVNIYKEVDKNKNKQLQSDYDILKNDYK